MPPPKKPQLSDLAAAQIEAAAKAKLGGRRGRPPSDETFFRDFPFIAAWLTFCELPDGTVKVPGCVQIRVDDGDFRATLQDAATGQAATALSATLEGCFKALEATLSDPNCKWQIWQDSKQKLRKPAKNGEA